MNDRELTYVGNIGIVSAAYARRISSIAINGGFSDRAVGVMVDCAEVFALINGDARRLLEQSSEDDPHYLTDPWTGQRVKRIDYPYCWPVEVTDPTFIGQSTG